MRCILRKKLKLQKDFWRVVKFNESLLCQKARLNWLKEGDCNFKIFHSVINWRRRRKFLKGLHIDRALVEEPIRMKEEVKNFSWKKIHGGYVVEAKSWWSPIQSKFDWMSIICLLWSLGKKRSSKLFWSVIVQRFTLSFLKFKFEAIKKEHGCGSWWLMKVALITNTIKT